MLPTGSSITWGHYQHFPLPIELTRDGTRPVASCPKGFGSQLGNQDGGPPSCALWGSRSRTSPDSSHRILEASELIRMHSGRARSKGSSQPLFIEADDPPPPSSLHNHDGTERITEERAAADLPVERGQVHRPFLQNFDRSTGSRLQPGFRECGLPPSQHPVRVAGAS